MSTSPLGTEMLNATAHPNTNAFHSCFFYCFTPLIGVLFYRVKNTFRFFSVAQYNDFYIRQLTELLTNYGDIFMLWLDGACGAKADGQPVQK